MNKTLRRHAFLCHRSCLESFLNCFFFAVFQNWNKNQHAVSPVAVNKPAKTVLSSQAALASAECLFSDLGRLKSRERQFLLSSSLEMTDTIRNYLNMRLKDVDARQVLYTLSVFHSSAHVLRWYLKLLVCSKCRSCFYWPGMTNVEKIVLTIDLGRHQLAGQKFAPGLNNKTAFRNSPCCSQGVAMVAEGVNSVTCRRKLAQCFISFPWIWNYNTSWKK